MLIFDFAKDLPFTWIYLYSDSSMRLALLHFSIFTTISLLPILFVSKSDKLFSKNDFEAALTPIKNLILTDGFLKLMILTFTSLVSPSLFLIWIGFDDFFYTDSYQKDVSSVSALARITLPASVLACSFINQRVIRYFLFFLIISPVFAQSSRVILVAIALYAIGSYFRNGGISKFKFLIVICLLVVFAYVSLNFRHNEVQGFIGNINTLLHTGIVFDNLVYSLNYIFSYSVALYSHVISYGSYTSEIFYVSINPLPGFLLDIELVQNARLNSYTPYSALSEFYLMSGNFGFFLFFLVSLLVTLVSKSASKRGLPFKLFIIFLVGFAAFMVTQYNLRNFMRFIYLPLVLIFLVNFIHFMKRQLR